MKRILLLAFALFSTAAVFSQAGLSSSYGTVEAVSYGNNSYKITVRSSRPHGEPISDAVIARPTGKTAALRALGRDSFELRAGGHSVRFALFQSGDTAGFRFALAPDERWYGGGERALPLNRRGYRLALNNNPWYGYGEGADNLNYSVPFFTSSGGYGLFFDNPARSYADIGKKAASSFEWGAPSGEWSVYVLLGDYAGVLSGYHKLTGTQPLPPRWAFGNLMSRFGYTSQAQVEGILAKMDAEHVPVEAIIFDLFWFGDSIKQTMGNLDWVNRQKWPDPRGMIAGFKKKGVNTILITEPFLVETSTNYAASKPFLAVDSAGKPYYLTDFYFGKGGLLDLFRNDAQAWFWSFYKKQMALGVEGWWGDLGEPERHPSNMYHNLRDLGYSKRLFKADEVHNIYGHAWTKMLYKYYAKEYPAKRLFSLNRSGFAGSQRFGIFPWTGDVGRNWSGLRAQLPVLLGMTMSGVPYVHSDAGGFAGGEGDGELYVRWLQFAAFTPIFRPHGTALYEVDKAAFSYPSEVALIDTPWRAPAKEAIRGRYLFLPYNYSLAYLQAKEGKPLMAPLYFYYPGDTTATKIQDQYFWGPNLLVCPVLEKGARSRHLYLPAGNWFDLGGRSYAGSRWLDLPVGLSTIPVFLKEGALVPTQQAARLRNTAADSAALPMLYYCPSSTPTRFDWYLDDGQSKSSLASGRYTLLRCEGVRKDSVIRVKATPSNQRYTRKQLQVLVAGVSSRPARVLVNGKSVPLVGSPTESAALRGQSTAYWNERFGTLLVTSAKGMKAALAIEVKM
ncbi:glycoside hydrolase family 31 protein [Flaviaesturariibacter aridisoli]|nr:glycoside hydrolase family 31 protein [Flaviaesturariibacter aridisoli]